MNSSTVQFRGCPRSSLGRGCISQADGPKESRVLAHVDGDVSVDHLDSNLLPGLEQAHPGCVAGVEVGLAGLDAPSALQKGLLVHHHLVAGEVGEVDVVDLMWSGEERGVREQGAQCRVLGGVCSPSWPQCLHSQVICARQGELQTNQEPLLFRFGLTQACKTL